MNVEQQVWRLELLYENGHKWNMFGDKTPLEEAQKRWEEFRALETGDPICIIDGYSNTADQAPNIVSVDLRNICGVSLMREY